MAQDVKRVILIAVALMVIGVIVPIAVGLVAGAGSVIIDSTTNATLSEIADPSVVLMIEVLIPIIAVIAIVLMFLPSTRKD